MPAISFISKDYYDFASRTYKASIDRYIRNHMFTIAFVGERAAREAYQEQNPFAVWEAENSFDLKKMYVEERIHNIQDTIGLIRRLIRR